MFVMKMTTHAACNHRFSFFGHETKYHEHLPLMRHYQVNHDQKMILRLLPTTTVEYNTEETKW